MCDRDIRCNKYFVSEWTNGSTVSFEVLGKMKKALAMVVILLAAISVGRTQDQADKKFVGTWKLVRIEVKHADRKVTDDPDLGPDCIGYITYDDHGRMNVQIMKPGRPRWKDDSKPTPDEAFVTETGYVAYMGTYEVHASDGYVIHHPELALEPEYVDSHQKRFFKFDGDLLKLTPPPFKVMSGELIERTLIWKKVD